MTGVSNVNKAPKQGAARACLAGIMLMRLARFLGIGAGLLLGLIFCHPAYAAEITVTPERTTLYADQEFTLTFSSNEQPDGAPDFSPLEQVLEIVNRSTRHNTQFINGVPSMEIVWQLQVFPKSSGVLQIPAIQFGRDASPPLTLTVLENNSGQQPQEIIVELESDAENPYVQQQIIVTQRLLSALPLRRNSASMTHPRISSGKGIVQQLGGIENKTVQRDGMRYSVSERRYAVFAHSSGELTLGRTVFQGIVNDGTQRRGLFGMSGKQVRRYSAPLELAIQAQPPNSGVNWLPATSLSINAHWQVPPAQFKTGEPVMLTLAVIAEGLLAEQLPELEVVPPSGIKAYANPAELVNNSEGGSVLATRQEQWVLIATAPGSYELPPITLRWWNLATQQLETAEIAPTLITVTGAAGDDPSPAAPPASEMPDAGGVGANPESVGEADANAEFSPEQPSLSAADEAAAELAQRQGEVSRPLFAELWLWLAGLLALLLVLLGIILRRRAQRSTQRHYQRTAHRVSSLDLLQQACRRDEAQKAYDALSDWVKQDLQLRPATLAQLRQAADLPLQQALDELSAVLYATPQESWRGKALWEAVRQHAQSKQAAATVQKRSGLLSLYPN